MMIPRTTVVLMAVTFLAGLCLDSAMLHVGAQTAGDNPELARLYAEDQSDRRDAEKIGWEKISERDALRKVDDDVTDGLRREFKAPSLAEARAKEAMFNKR